MQKVAMITSAALRTIIFFFLNARKLSALLIRARIYGSL